MPDAYRSTGPLDDGKMNAMAAEGWQLVCCGQPPGDHFRLYWRRAVDGPPPAADETAKGET